LVGHNSLKYAEQLGRPHLQTSLFQCFSFGTLPQSFSDLEHATRNRPFAKQRSLATFDQQNPALLNNDGAHANERLLWIFALHFDRHSAALPGRALT
jgi:hypothetical protein